MILQLLLDVARLLLGGFGPGAQLAHDPLVRALDVIAELREGGRGRVRGAVLEVCRLLARLGLKLINCRTLVDRLFRKSV